MLSSHLTPVSVRVSAGLEKSPKKSLKSVPSIKRPSPINFIQYFSVPAAATLVILFYKRLRAVRRRYTSMNYK